MGGSFSKKESNDSLVDKLVKSGYIKTPSVQLVYRSVDRGAYVNPRSIQFLSIYDKDTSWKVGNLYLSTPIIYATVLENLDLQPGMYFLNVGSGTGYLSTMCGLLIGKNGVNHGIELHADNVNHARAKQEEFRKTAPRTSKFNFCNPVFIVGDFMRTAPAPKRYDRIYVGARCTDESVGRIIDMLKVGGICIVPVGDSLIKITRTGVGKLNQRKILLRVTMKNLVYPDDAVPNSGNKLQLPSIPKSLAFQALSKIPGVTISKVREWLQTGKLVLPGEQIYDDICQYVGNGQEHGYGIKVLNIIRINRKNDPPLGQRDPILRKKLKMLLWHGTQVQCVPSILQDGLQPPQAPAGQMFGPGIYFADRASKSANYSAKIKMRPQSGEIGCMFLCEVLLGKIFNAKVAHHDYSKAPTITSKAGVEIHFDSVKCTGENVPNREEQKRMGPNVILPYGKTIKNDQFPSYSVNFNEFTVYSGDRCKPNYLLEFQFTPMPEQYAKTCNN